MEISSSNSSELNFIWKLLGTRGNFGIVLKKFPRNDSEEEISSPIWIFTKTRKNFERVALTLSIAWSKRKKKKKFERRSEYSFSIAKNGSRRDKLWRRVEEDRKKLTLWPPSQRAIESISVGSRPSKRSIVHSVTERFGSMEDLMSRIPTLFRVTLTGLDPGYKDRAKGENLFLFRASEVRRLATKTFSAILWLIFEMIERGAYDWTR